MKNSINEANVDGNSFEHIQYDAVSYAGIRQANKESFGLTTVAGDPTADGIIPDYDFFNLQDFFLMHIELDIQ